MYDAILVPTDGSETSMFALDHAAQLAAVHDASVHLLYVAETPGIAPTPTAGRVLDELEEHGEKIVEEAAARLDGRVHTAVARGPPHRAILDYASSGDIDLIVMGTHGRTGLSHALLGSVAERVVRLAEVPVLTLRGPGDDEGATDDAHDGAGTE